MKQFTHSSLTKNQKHLRKRILEISHAAKLSHLGSCLSVVDIIDTVYSVKKKQDIFILSNGHAAVAWYTVLEKHGFIKNVEKQHLYIHPDRNVKLGIHVSTGSLGQGFPIALGTALADRKRTVFCMLSDGECAEGSVWETLRIAVEQKVDNIKVIVNANGWGAYDPISISSLIKRLRSFGCHVTVINGHAIEEIIQALQVSLSGTVEVIVAKTTSEQFPFLKGQDAHYYVMTENNYQESLLLLQ